MKIDFLDQKHVYSLTGALVFCLIFCISSCVAVVPTYVLPESWGRYRESWYRVSADRNGDYGFHCKFGKIVAETKLNRNVDRPDNMAAFGLTLRSAKNGKTISCISVLPIVCSTIDQIKDPIISSDGRSAITVRDLLGEDILHKKYRAHKVLEMAEWLAPWKYSEKWGMGDLIKYERMLIEKSISIAPDKNTLTRLTILKPVDPKVGKVAGDIFHCEQVVIYKMLTDSEFLATAINELMKRVDKKALPSKICFDLDIVTFNDMCPKCFSTVFFRLEEIKQEVSRQIFRYFQSDQATEFLLGKFPVVFRILVSSARPYKIEMDKVTENLKSRECEECEANSMGACSLIDTIIREHVPALGEKVDKIPMEDGVFQFANPWISEVFHPLREKHQKILEIRDQLQNENSRLSRLDNTQNLQEKIEKALRQQIPSSVSSVKNLLSFDIKKIKDLLLSAQKIK